MNWSRLLGGGGRTAALAVAAGVATALTFVAVRLLAPPGSYAFGLFFERGYIQYIAVYCFWATVATLALNNLALVRERAAFERAKLILAEPRFAGVMIWSDAAVVREAFEADRRHAASVTFSRVTHALDRLRRMQSTKALDDYFRNRSDLDASKLETSYAGVRYFVWLLPTLGLIGTVMGMGRAISGFGTVLQEAQNFLAVKQALPDIMRELGTAFDTTFLGVGLSAVAVCYMSFLLKAQERLLEEIDHLCLDGVCALFQEHSKASEEMLNGLQEASKALREAMNGNRAAVEGVLRHELLPVLTDALALQEAIKGLRETMNGNRAELARVARDELPVRVGAELAPRVDALGEQLGQLLTRLGNTVAQAAAAQKQATDGTADAMRAVAAAVQRNTELLSEVVARLPAPPPETAS